MMITVWYVDREVAVGRSSTEPVRAGKLPSVRTAEPWDGKDGVVSLPTGF